MECGELNPGPEFILLDKHSTEKKIQPKFFF